MKNSTELVVDNLKAQLKCAQVDFFSVLKRFVLFFSMDTALKQILNQPYYTVNEDEYTLGLGGEKCYGLIENYNLKKRDAIVSQAKKQLTKSIDSELKILEMELIISHYQQTGIIIKNVISIPMLKTQLRTLRFFYYSILDREDYLPYKNLN